MRHPGRIGDLAGLDGKDELPSVQADHVIRQLLQVVGDMARHEDSPHAAPLFLRLEHAIPQKPDHLATRQGIQSRRRFV